MHSRSQRPLPAIALLLLCALFLIFRAAPPAAAEDLFKTCPKCGETIYKPEDKEIKFCYGCGADLKGIKYRRKSERELLGEALAAKVKDLGEAKVLTAEEWYRRGETTEDELMKLACYRQSCKVRDNARVRSNIGAIFDTRGMVDEALAEFRKAVELDGDYAIGHNNLGKALLDKGLIEEARGHFDRAIALEPKNPIFLKNKGDLLCAAGDPKAAETAYRAVLKMDPDGPAGRLAAFKLGLIAPEPEEPIPGEGKPGDDSDAGK